MLGQVGHDLLPVGGFELLHPLRGDPVRQAGQGGLGCLAWVWAENQE